MKIRFPKKRHGRDLSAQLKALAKANGRSVNKELIAMAEAYFARTKGG